MIVAAAYGGIEDLAFGPEYLIPKPFDPRLIVKIAPAVAKAAMESGVATRPIADLEGYGQRLAAVRLPQRHAHAADICRGARRCRRNAAASSTRKARVSACCAPCRSPWMRSSRRRSWSGRPAVIERAIKRHGLRIRIGEHFTVVNPEHDERFREYWQDYHKLTERHGVTAQYAKLEMRRRTTLIAAMLLKKGEADGMICGTISTTARHLHYIDQVIGRRAGAPRCTAR